MGIFSMVLTRIHLSSHTQSVVLTSVTFCASPPPFQVSSSFLVTSLMFISTLAAEIARASSTLQRDGCNPALVFDR